MVARQTGQRSHEEESQLEQHGRRGTLSRRRFLGQTAAAGAMMLGAPAVHAQERSLKVGAFGGFFEETFNSAIWPEFTAASGIAVESVSQPSSDAWLLTLQQAAQAGVAAADVSMMGRVNSLRGVRQGLWLPLDSAKMPGVSNVSETYLEVGPDGQLYGVGSINWWLTLVSNTEQVPVEPTSWTELWRPDLGRILGLFALANNSFLLEIAAKTYFGGYDILTEEEGILTVMNKVAELKGNVLQWSRDEAQFQAALQTGEVPMGQYYHDVTSISVAQGLPVRSTFPTEGGVTDGGNWTVIKTSSKLEEAQVLIDWCLSPAAQDLIARNIGAAPVIDRSLLSLTDAEFAGISSAIDPVVPQYAMHLERGDWIEQKWLEIVLS